VETLATIPIHPAPSKHLVALEEAIPTTTLPAPRRPQEGSAEARMTPMDQETPAPATNQVDLEEATPTITLRVTRRPQEASVEAPMTPMDQETLATHQEDMEEAMTTPTHTAQATPSSTARRVTALPAS